MHGPPKGFADLSNLGEDERIQVIGNYAMTHPGERLGVPTDDVPGKPERYKEKLEHEFPSLTVVIAGRAQGIAVLHVTLVVTPSVPTQGPAPLN